MFSADYFDYYSNFWKLGETIGLNGGNSECKMKKEEKLEVYLWQKLINYQKYNILKKPLSILQNI